MSGADASKKWTADRFASAFNVSRETIERLNLYGSTLRTWQARINLVADATLDDVWGRHFADSAQLAAHLPGNAEHIVDLGSGAGFPGLVLAIVLNDANVRAKCVFNAVRISVPRITLIESDQRKGAFMREVARQTRIPVDILSIRIEDAAQRARLGRIDVLTARALAPLDKLFAHAESLIDPDGVCLFLKGKSASDEVEAARRQWSFEVSLVPSVTAADAQLVVVRHLTRKVPEA